MTTLHVVEPQPVPALDWLCKWIAAGLSPRTLCETHGVIRAKGNRCPACERSGTGAERMEARP